MLGEGELGKVQTRLFKSSPSHSWVCAWPASLSASAHGKMTWPVRVAEGGRKQGESVEGSCSPSDRTPRLWEEIRFSSQSLGELLKGSEMIGFEFLSNGWPVGNGWPCGSREACGMLLQYCWDRSNDVASGQEWRQGGRRWILIVMAQWGG